MVENVDVRVTPALHPHNVSQLDGIDEDTLPALGAVVTAFDEAYQGIGQVWTAREAAKTHPGWTPATQLIQVQDLSDKVFARVAKSLDAQRASLEKGIAFLEKELSQPVEGRASHPMSKEIRAHIKALPNAARMGFIKNAIDEGDHDVPMAALGAPSFLSGIDAGIQQTLLRMYHEKQSPQLAKRLKAFQGAKSLIEERGALVMKELEKAVGARPDQVQRLRNARTAAEQAFVLKDIG